MLNNTMRPNKTRKQHYISRVEQKLNTSNPNAEPENKRIFSFEVKDRENFKVKLESKKGRNISNNLIEQDLFTFDVGSNESERYNFEDFFRIYEAKSENLTNMLLQKIDTIKPDITNELIELFQLKIVNLIRNPFSVQKVINTLGALKRITPTENEQKEMFKRVLYGQKNHSEHLCQRLNITLETYEEWLSIIFLMLIRFRNNEPNIVEEVANGLFLDTNTFIKIELYYYTSESCVLSDRSCFIAEPTPDYVTLGFNLSSNLFVQYSFININSLSATKKHDASIVEAYKNMPKKIKANLFRDNLEALKLFNQRTMYQCYERVYCSKSQPYGLQIV